MKGRHLHIPEPPSCFPVLFMDVTGFLIPSVVDVWLSTDRGRSMIDCADSLGSEYDRALQTNYSFNTTIHD